MHTRTLNLTVELKHGGMDEVSLDDWEAEVVAKINEVASVCWVRRKDTE